VVECAVLDGKQRFDSFFVEQLDAFFIFDVVVEISSRCGLNVVVNIYLSFVKGYVVEFVLWFSLHGMVYGVSKYNLS